MSLEFYGIEKYYDCILNIICNLEFEEDNFELFCKYVDNIIMEEICIDVKKRILKIYIKVVKKWIKLLGEGEFFVLLLVFNVDLIVDNMGRGEWVIYMLVICCYLSFFDFLIIFCIELKNGDYMLYVIEFDICFCC